MSTRSLVRALIAGGALLALAHCRTQASPPSTPDTPSKSPPAPAWSDWSPRAAIATCASAVEDVRGFPPELERSRALMVTCASMVGGARCRDVTKRQWGPAPTPTFREAVTICASEYCPRLGDAPALAACHFDPSDGSFDFAGAWVGLRQSMLLHDFPESDVPDAARTLVAAMEYVGAVPPPSFSVADAPPPEFEVELEPGGALTVLRSGGKLATVATVDELSTVLPKPAGNAAVTLRTGANAPYERVIGVINALHDIGYDNVSFAAAR